MSRCCSCQEPNTSSCRVAITSADLATLLYVEGLDANLCLKYSQITELFQFRDCAGNIILSNSEIVTCADFRTRLCATLEALASGGSVELGVTQVVGSDCLLYTIPETPLVANDSTSVDFTTSGDFNHTLTAVVKISQDPGNDISIHTDGIYSNTCDRLASALSGGEVIPGQTLLIGQDCLGYTIPVNPSQTPINVTDTNCINLTASGPSNTNLQADIIISPDVGNQVSCTANGLFVPSAEVILNPVDTNCINMSITESPPGTYAISADPIISPADGNQLQCTNQGLYVPTTDLLVGDTNCINLTLSDGILTAAPIIATNAPGYPPGCNGLVCDETGLWTYPDSSGLTGEVGTSDTFYAAPASESDIIAHPDLCITIPPNNTCRAQTLSIFTRIPEWAHADSLTLNEALYLRLRVNQNINLPGILVTGWIIKTEWWEYSPAGLHVTATTPANTILNAFTLPVGFVGGTYCVNGFVELLQGDTNLIQLQGLIIRYIIQSQ